MTRPVGAGHRPLYALYVEPTQGKRVGLAEDHVDVQSVALQGVHMGGHVVARGLRQLGPGSLFTSVLAVVAVPSLRDALAATPGRKVYVCNLRPQLPETAGYDVAAHVHALQAHGLDVDVVLCHPDSLPVGPLDVECVQRPVARPDGMGHDPALLAAALEELLLG